MNNTVQKTSSKSASVNTELMRVSEIGFHCAKNTRFLNTKI
jgi:hypothetical protein